jgi:cell division transport system permease protein
VALGSIPGLAKGRATGRTKTRARRRNAPGLAELPRAWLSHHVQSAVATLGRLMRAPLPTIMTVAVIGVALALPAGLYVLTENLRQLVGSWDQAAAVSVFLRREVSDQEAGAVAEHLRGWPELEGVQVIGAQEALDEFREQAGFGDALAHLTENPLPAVLGVSPRPAYSKPETIGDLEERLRELPEADFVRVDTQWLMRFQAILDLIQAAVLSLGGLLGLGVLLIVGNTIRLEILNRREEIEIMELVGATASFVRRPFLYAGGWYGFLGGLSAWFLVTVAVFALQGPVSRLASLYGSEFPLSGLGFLPLLGILAGSMLLGLVGSWIAVNRHLKGIEPG